MNRWIVGVSLLCLLASCSKDNDDTPQSGNNNVNGGAGISFSSNVSSSIIVEVDGPTSRAPLTTFEPNSQIGIYGIPAFEGGRNEDCDLYNRKREAGLPCMMQISILGAVYKTDAPFGALLVSLSTVLSVITIPVAMTLLSL